jgi:hypothetical protein
MTMVTEVVDGLDGAFVFGGEGEQLCAQRDYLFEQHWVDFGLDVCRLMGTGLLGRQKRSFNV